MAKKASSIPEAKLAAYEKLIAANPNVERKGAAMPYTSLNGHMFSFLTEDGTMALRLSDDDRESFLKKYKTKLCERHGTVMKEYVVVPASLLKKPKDLQAAFEQSIDYVRSLKPKATTGKKTRAKKKAAKKKR